MIHTSRQLKALVRNRSKGDSAKAARLCYGLVEIPLMYYF